MSRTAANPQLPLEQRFSYRFDMLNRALGQQMLLRVAREHGLNLAQYRIMTVLANRKTPSIRDIAAHTHLDKAQVTRALADLAGRGLVTQIVDQRDRRLRVVALTRSGRATVAATVPFAIERQRRLEACLSARELRVLWKALAVLLAESERMLAEEQRKGARKRRRGDGSGRSTEAWARPSA